MNANDLVIRTQGLSKTCGDVEALKNLDLQVPQKSIFAFLGPNGSGKTTYRCWLREEPGRETWPTTTDNSVPPGTPGLSMSIGLNRPRRRVGPPAHERSEDLN